MKIFHEAPIALFNAVQKRTDGDYALCHLLEENKEYAAKFLSAKERNREIILDNSAFELDAPVDWDLLNYWTQKLEPAWVVLPDALNDGPTTVENAERYLAKYRIPKVTSIIGVVQGRSYDEIVDCYKALSIVCPMLAFSFNYSWWNIYEDPVNLAKYKTHERILMLNRLEQDGVINTKTKHHLLGCNLPTEFIFQRRPWIYSVDTSNPVMYGMQYGPYPVNGPSFKPSDKLYTHINTDISEDEYQAIMHNIAQFRRWCSC